MNTILSVSGIRASFTPRLMGSRPVAVAAARLARGLLAAAKSVIVRARGSLRPGGRAATWTKLAGRVGIVPVVVGSLFCGGCANLSNRSSGFLGSYDNLKPDPKDSHRLVYERTDWQRSGYTSVLIEPAVVRLTAEDKKKITTQEMAELAAYNDRALRKVFAKDWAIVTAAQPGTLRVRSAITGVDPCNPALNVATALVICPVDNGGVSMEYEVRDAANGEQLVALAGYSNSTPLEGLWAFTRLGEAHFAIDHWSAALGKIVRPSAGKHSAASSERHARFTSAAAPPPQMKTPIPAKAGL